MNEIKTYCKVNFTETGDNVYRKSNNDKHIGILLMDSCYDVNVWRGDVNKIPFMTKDHLYYAGGHTFKGLLNIIEEAEVILNNDLCLTEKT